MNTAARAPLSVFIAEDSAALAEILAELVTVQGRIHLVGTAASQDEAIAEVLRLQPDVVILDMQLKPGTGFGVLQATRSALKSSTFIVYSNYVSPEYRQRSLALGADYYLDKSRDFAGLVQLLHEISARRG
jgi:DNA-binding NarL/FixJ family response regulator